MPDDQENNRTILELKDILEKTEEEILDKNNRLIQLLEQDSAKNDLISLLKSKILKLEEEKKSFDDELAKSQASIRRDEGNQGFAFSKKAESLLEKKEKKVQFLLSKLKEKDSLVKKMSEVAFGNSNKSRLLSEFNDNIELLEKDNSSLKARLMKKDRDLSELIRKNREKDDIITRIENEKQDLQNNPAIKDDKRIRLLLEKAEEKTKLIHILAGSLKEKDAELRKKDAAISSFAKQRSEKDILIKNLNDEVEKAASFNKRLFQESNNLRSVIKYKSERTADLEAENRILKRKQDSENNAMTSIRDENEILKKKLAEQKERLVDEIGNLEGELLKQEAFMKEELQKYDTRIRKLLRENAEKEMRFREKTKNMNDMLDKQNYLVLEKERKEKEMLDDISLRFNEIFTLRNEINEVSKDREFDFSGKDEFEKEEDNNLKSLIKIGLAHKDSLEDIKKSLLAAGYPHERIDRAMKGISKDDRKKEEKQS